LSLSKETPTGLRSILGRSWEIFRTLGIRGLWFKVLGETVYRRVAVFEKKLSADLPRSVVPEHMEIRLLQAPEIDEFVKFRTFNDRATVVDRLANGQICVVVKHRNEFIHCTWITGGWVRIDYQDCDIELANGVAYVYESYTSPAWRRRGVATMRSPALSHYCLEYGYKLRIAVVGIENLAAFGATEKTGNIVAGELAYFGAGPFKKHYLRYKSNDPPFRIVKKSGNQVPACGESYWSKVPETLDSQSHYLDPFLAQLKRRENLRLVLDWSEPSAVGPLLKTDAFEEAMGDDSFLADLQEMATEITGIDVSHAIVKRASENYKGKSADFLVADVRHLPFRACSFSTVVSPSTLDHFPEPSDLGVSLLELFRIMRPGGQLIITLDNRQNIMDPLLRLVHKLGMIPYYMGRSYTVSELRKELECAGFYLKETTAILHNPRLFAVGPMKLVRWLGWQWLIRAMQKLFLKAQGLEKTWLCYYTGSFVAALAVRPESNTGECERE
jgi:SAM-dependent methyltransferase/GNAT superfamily N-acetyltransferase